MAIYTNVSPGPRVVNVKDGFFPDSKNVRTKHVLLMPGESADIDPLSDDAAFNGLVDAKQIIKGTPKEPESNADPVGLRARIEELEEKLQEAAAEVQHHVSELFAARSAVTDVQKQAEDARSAGMAQIADLKKALEARDAEHAAAVNQLQDEHNAQVAALTAPPPTEDAKPKK